MPSKLTRKEFLVNAGVAAATLAVGGAFLRPSSAAAAPIRPPGARSEKEFLSLCIRCGRCAQACPNQCIASFTGHTGKPLALSPGAGEEGTPVIFPRRQACNLCQGVPGDALRCTEACPSGALEPIDKDAADIRKKVAMGKASLDKNLCYSYNGSSCGVCVRACPLEGKALKTGQFERPLLDAAECVGCGLCERACIRYPQAIIVRARV